MVLRPCTTRPQAPLTSTALAPRAGSAVAALLVLLAIARHVTWTSFEHRL